MTRLAKPAVDLSSQRQVFKRTALSLAVATCLGTAAPAVLANPTGATVANGSASFATQGDTLTVTTTHGTVINWNQFNIGANETTRFIQPSVQSSVLNRVVGGNPTEILGTLQSNGQVFIINPNGILFGRSAIIDVPGLVASTLNLTDGDYLNHRFNFTGGGLGAVVNQGTISTSLGGRVMLIGSEVRNEGIITTPQGRVVLAAGNSVSLADTAGPELSVTLTASGNKAVNLGEISASGGKIDMFGALIRQQGVLRADSASVDAEGRIVLKATESTTVSGTISATNSAGSGGTIEVLGRDVTLTGTARLDASGAKGGGTVLVGGDWQGKNAAIPNAQTVTMATGAVIKADATDTGNGGKVVLWSDNSTDFYGSIFARGGANGGNGGQVETSGHWHLGVGGTVNTLAPKGKTGMWLLDPASYCFEDSAPFGCASNVLTSAVASALNTTDVTYSATDYIYIGSLSLSAYGITSSAAGHYLKFDAPYIGVANPITTTAAAPINISMSASGSSASFPGMSGAISLGPGAAIQTYGGQVDLQASDRIVFGNTTSINVNGTPGGYGDNTGENFWDIRLRAPMILTSTASFYGNDLEITTNNLAGAGAPTGTVDWVSLTTYTPGTNVLVGSASGNPACSSALCVNNQLGSISVADGVTIAAGRCAIPKSCSLDKASIDGDIIIGGFGPYDTLAQLGNRDLEFVAKNITVNQQVPVHSSSSYTGFFATNTFTNNVGASAIDTSSGGNWYIAVGNEAGSNFNGLVAPRIYLDLVGVSNYDENDTWPAGNAIFLLSGLTPIDPCVQSPTLCAGNKATLTSIFTPSETMPLTTTDGTTLPAPLTIDAKLAVAGSGTSSVQEAKLAVTRKDSDKSVGEVQAEAKKAREDAGKAEAAAKKAEQEAKKAEADAKQAETEAKSAKTPAEKAAARQKAEAKKLEAEQKKAEVEAKKAEAEAKQAEAESREALAEAKAAARPEAAAPVVAKQAQAQVKQAEAQARKAEAEARQAAVEAKAARDPDQKQAAQKTVEAKKIEAEAHKTEAQARKAEAEAKEAEAQAKAAPNAQARAAAEKRAEAKRTEAEVKQAEADGKQAQAEGKQAEAQGKRAEVKAKEAQAEAKQAEAEMKAAKTPEQKLAATQKAEVKKTEAEARKVEADARKTEAEGKKMEAEAKKTEAEVKKAEAEARQAKAPEQKAAAEKKAEVKKAEAEAKQAQADAKKTEADGKQAQADAKQAEAEAKGSHSPGGRAVVEKQAEAKKAEAEAKRTEAEAKKAEAEVKKAEAEVKKAEAAGKKAEAEAKKAEVKRAEAETKKAEAGKKRMEAEKKAEEHRLAVEKRREERRVEAAKAFGAIATASANRSALENLAALRHELKTEILKPALSILEKNPATADLPPCGPGSEVCVPAALQQAVALPPPPVPKVAFLPQIQRKVAVVIGVNKYADPAIPSLESAVPDAKAIGQQLEAQLGYDVRLVEDASRADIVSTLNKLSREVGTNDSVTVYYAGHGYLSEKTQTGYWIPADAKATSPDNWISNNDISRLLANIPAKQVMLVSDSCYSGSLAKEQKIAAGAGSLDPTGILAKRSVTVMSSGGEEPVSDEGKDGHSIFAYSFMKTLKSVGQVNSGAKLFETVRKEVSQDYPQTPQYGGALSAGHAPGGDYLFETRSYK